MEGKLPDENRKFLLTRTASRPRVNSRERTPLPNYPLAMAEGELYGNDIEPECPFERIRGNRIINA